MNLTPDFPAWIRRFAPMKAPVAEAALRLRQITLDQLELRLGNCLPVDLLDTPASGTLSRQRIYWLARIFWGWIWQMLNHNAPCREVVRQVQALCALQAGPPVDERTGGFCHARAALPLPLLDKALLASARTAQRRAGSQLLVGNRPIKVIDGSALRLADTAANQKRFPQPPNQKRGCGFPVMKLVVLFCLSSGAVLARAAGSLWQSESNLFGSLLSSLRRNDIVVGDRGFGNFVMVALLSTMGVDFIGRVPTNIRRVDFRAGRRLGEYDRLVCWHKGPRQSKAMDAQQWASLPQSLTVRIVRTRVRQRGFRSRQITLVTTLLDPVLYPAEQLLAAYARRWRLELCLDDLKTTLGLENLKCLSPAMAQKELLVGLIAHNLLRCVMAQSARSHAAPLDQISFKGSLDTLRQFSHALCQSRCARRKKQLWDLLLQTLARDLVPQRPGRREPRAVKHRPKYPFLSQPRHLFRDRPRRSVRRSRSNMLHLI